MDQYREVDQDDPVAAFEQLRGEVALLRRAVEGLTAARESIDIPDYEPTLARTEKVLGILVKQTEAMRQSPAMALTPETIGSRLNASVKEAVHVVQGQAQASKAALDNAVGDLRRLTGSVRQAKEQTRWLFISGVVGLTLGLLLYAALAGPIARMMPASWHWPERMAARMLGKDTIWNAGQHLMASVSQPSWDAIADAANLVRDNIETIERCRKAAVKAEKAVSCTIEVEGE